MAATLERFPPVKREKAKIDIDRALFDIEFDM